MHKDRNKIVFSVIFLLLLAYGWQVIAKREADVWRVIGKVPSAIVRDTIDTPTYYIIRQTHEPFFRSDDLQNFTSRIIKRWHRSVDSRNFVFYPDTSLRFNREEALTREIFEAQLSSVTARFGAEYKLVGFPDRIEISFASPQRRYLYFLTWYENAPAIRSGNIEYGLGEFYISNFGLDKVVMERKRRVSNGYNEIFYLNYVGDKDPNLQDWRVQDFNLLSSYQQPEWIRHEYVGYKNPDPRSIVLLINHPDRKVRRLLYNCLNVSEFRSAFIPSRKEFHDIATVLPVGIPGAKAGLPEQSCSAADSGMAGEILLINQRSDNDETLPAYLGDLRRRTGLRIKAKKMKYDETAALINGRLRKPFSYNLFQIILDTFRPDHKAFFEFTCGEKSALDYRPKETEELFSGLLNTEEPDARVRIATELAAKLGSEAMLLPLYQTYSYIYYPKKIKNLAMGSSFTQYPEIAEFRW